MTGTNQQAGQLFKSLYDLELGKLPCTKQKNHRSLVEISHFSIGTGCETRSFHSLIC